MTTDKHKALELLFRQHYTSLYHFAMRMVDDDEACRDLVGEAFRQAYDQLDSIPPERQKAYIFSLVRNKCIDYVRHLQARQRYAEYYEHTLARTNDNEAATLEELEAQLQQMRAIIDSDLTPRTRLVLERCYLHRKKYAEVAQELGISVSAVRKHIVAALKTLRAKMPKKSE
ncbi:MAG: sigma-70 family RNA polymerase sigma factor [Prevotella sp.]|nr:sigma-70 family RNA polymerase sigma factor [Prevotella sp.]